MTSLDDIDKSCITILGSTTVPQDGSPSKFSISVPKLDASFTGTGDLMAALLLARVTDMPSRFAAAVELAVASVQNVLLDTVQHAGAALRSSERSADVMKLRELRIVQNQGALLHPEVLHRAVGAGE